MSATLLIEPERHTILSVLAAAALALWKAQAARPFDELPVDALLAARLPVRGHQGIGVELLGLHKRGLQFRSTQWQLQHALLRTQPQHPPLSLGDQHHPARVVSERRHEAAALMFHRSQYNAQNGANHLGFPPKRACAY